MIVRRQIMKQYANSGEDMDYLYARGCHSFRAGDGKAIKRRLNKRARRYNVDAELMEYMEDKMVRRYSYIFEGNDIAEGACITYKSDCQVEFKPFEFHFPLPLWHDQ